ncbi:hypothetical protein [Roseateles sp. LKC17W]
MAQFKCTGADGKASFQQMPCAAGGKQQALVLKTPPPDAASNRPSDGITTLRDVVTGEPRIVKQMEADRRVRELEQEIRAAESSIAGRSGAMDRELVDLRNRKQFANNNLADATYEQSISAEMQAVAAKYKALNDIDLERLRQLNTSLVAAKQAAGK